MTAQTSQDVAVSEIAALILRTAQSLAEAGRPELAERCYAVVDRDGLIRLRFDEIPQGGPDNPVVDKALSIDPAFEKGETPCAS